MRVTVEHASGEKVVIEDGVAATAAKSQWDGTSIGGPVVKTAPSRRYTLQVAYPANKPDAVRAADGYRDFASPEAVEDAAWEFLVKSPNVGLWHADHTTGAGKVVESYVYRGPDWTLTAHNGSQQVIKAGDWLVGIVWSPDTWPMVLEGRIGGVSMQGTASRRRPSRESLSRLRS
jgi:Putative phage serine protease XkdF